MYVWLIHFAVHLKHNITNQLYFKRKFIIRRLHLLLIFIANMMRASWWLSGKEPICQCRRHEFQFLIWEDPTCHKATKPMCRNYWACAWCPGASTTEPTCHNYWGPHPRACVLQQEKPPQWEAQAPQLEGNPLLATTRESLCSNEDPAQPKLNLKMMKASFSQT